MYLIHTNVKVITLLYIYTTAAVQLPMRDIIVYSGLKLAITT